MEIMHEYETLLMNQISLVCSQSVMLLLCSTLSPRGHLKNSLNLYA